MQDLEANVITPEQIENVKKQGARQEVARHAEVNIREALESLEESIHPTKVREAIILLEDAVTYLKSLV